MRTSAAEKLEIIRLVEESALSIKATLATLLGHADVSTTANHYAIFDSDEIAARHEEHSPLKSVFTGTEGSLTTQKKKSIAIAM